MIDKSLEYSNILPYLGGVGQWVGVHSGLKTIQTLQKIQKIVLQYCISGERLFCPKTDFSKFKHFAGHSLGEYSALVCSGSLNFDDALYLLCISCACT